MKSNTAGTLILLDTFPVSRKLRQVVACHLRVSLQLLSQYYPFGGEMSLGYILPRRSHLA